MIKIQIKTRETKETIVYKGRSYKLIKNPRQSTLKAFAKTEEIIAVIAGNTGVNEDGIRHHYKIGDRCTILDIETFHRIKTLSLCNELGVRQAVMKKHIEFYKLVKKQ